MEPLARYTERFVEVRRDFRLHPDRVTIDARWLHKGRIHQEVRLATLVAPPRRFMVRYHLYRRAGWVLAVSSLAFAALYYYAGDESVGILGYAALGVAALGAVTLALSYPLRLVEFARFDARSGRGGLDVGAAGNDAATFRAFVEAVEERVRRS